MTAPLVTIDYALAMTDGVGAFGIPDAVLDAESATFERAVRRVLDEAAAGLLGFWNLPTDSSAVRAIDRYVASLSNEITDVMLLGIGGSSLGARAIYQALGAPPEIAYGSRSAEGRRLLLPDNSDPWLLATLLDHLDPKSTLVIATSKSGGTVETAAQLLVVRRWLDNKLSKEQARQHFVVITDPEAGPLRALAKEEGLVAFDVPPNVGGRFSVLTPVGILPARLAGFDTTAMMQGAARMAESCARPRLRDNPAGVLAALHVLHHRLRGHSVHVLMPYADALRPFAAWYVQLWAESLGKRIDRQGRVVETGPTPLPAVGATDQHAQVQLFMEGPRDKLLTFIGVEHPATDLEIPKAEGAFSYLGGHTLGELLDAERRATAIALARDGRPSITLKIPKVDAASLGALFFLYEAATAFAGELYGINTFDQPGVEEGKRLAFGLLGRPSFEEAGREIRTAEQNLPSRHKVS